MEDVKQHELRAQTEWIVPRQEGAEKEGEETTVRNYITDEIRVKRVEDVEKGVVRACGTSASSRDHIALGMTTVKGVFAVG